MIFYSKILRYSIARTQVQPSNLSRIGESGNVNHDCRGPGVLDKYRSVIDHVEGSALGLSGKALEAGQQLLKAVTPLHGHVPVVMLYVQLLGTQRN